MVTMINVGVGIATGILRSYSMPQSGRPGALAAP